MTLLLTFSGIDGAGKSTQIAELCAFFEARGQRPARVWSRGGYTSTLDTLKSLVRKLAGARLPLPGESKQRQQYMRHSIVRKLWLSVAIIDLVRLYGIQVRLWRLLGRTVVCDRYLWDTLVDFRINFPEEPVANWWLWRLLERIAVQPDVAFLLMLPLEESIRRCTLKDDPFPSPNDVQVQRFAMYQELVDSRKFVAVDASLGIDCVFSTILASIEATIDEPNGQPGSAISSVKTGHGSSTSSTYEAEEPSRR